jgi:hypothetical protein
MPGFSVISFDGDRQEVFFDSILAENAHNAAELVRNLRPDAVVVAALDPTRLHQLAEVTENLTEEGFAWWLQTFPERTKS